MGAQTCRGLEGIKELPVLGEGAGATPPIGVFTQAMKNTQLFGLYVYRTLMSKQKLWLKTQISRYSCKEEIQKADKM